MCGLVDGVVTAVCAGGPVHKIGPADQVRTAYDTAGKLAGPDDSAKGIFTDVHSFCFGTGNGFFYIKNVTGLLVFHLQPSSFLCALSFALIITEQFQNGFLNFCGRVAFREVFPQIFHLETDLFLLVGFGFLKDFKNAVNG